MESLIVDHLDLVPRVVSSMLRRRRVASHVGRDELVAAGNVGLVQAALRFRPIEGSRFVAFAWMRIQGAVLDYMRSNSPLTRGDLAKVRAGDRSREVYFNSFEEWREHGHDIAAPPAVADVDEVPFEQTTLRHALRILPAREEKVLLLYYRDGFNMRQISERIGVNESRVSQLHARALRRLRTIVTVNPWAN